MMNKIFKIQIMVIIMVLVISGCKQEEVHVTAHRGGAGIAPENTMAAIYKAIELGSEFSEIDVQESADGVLIVFHDKNLERLAGIDTNLWVMNYEDLKTMDVGTSFSKEFKGEHIPLFTDVLDAVDGKMKLNVEIKMNGHQKNLTEHVIQMLEEKNFIDQCIVTSFNFAAVDKIRELNKNFKIGYIFSKFKKGIDVINADVDLLSMSRKIVTKEFIDQAHASGKEVHVWTVNEEEEMLKLIEWGVDNIITNYPGKLIDLLK